jgi:hypothetical protein
MRITPPNITALDRVDTFIWVGPMEMIAPYTLLAGRARVSWRGRLRPDDPRRAPLLMAGKPMPDDISTDRDLRAQHRSVAEAQREFGDSLDGDSELAIAGKAVIYADRLGEYRQMVAAACLPDDLCRRLIRCETCDLRCPGVTACKA